MLDNKHQSAYIGLNIINLYKMETLKSLLVSILFLLLLFANELKSQQYHPFPEENAFWTVNEFPSTIGSQNYIYTIKGDTVFNNNQYKKIFKLSKIPNSSDTLWELHSFMRQNVVKKKVYFIRHYQGESIEKLGYDFDVSIGDTVYLPAFDYQNTGDSVFKVISPIFDSTQLNDGTYRKNYFFGSLNSGVDLNPYVTEGVGTQRTPFPNLFFYIGNYQSSLLCLQVNGELIKGDTSFFQICGLTIVNTNEYRQNFKITASPNPCNEYLLITLPDNLKDEVELEFTSIHGIIVLQKTIPYFIKEYKMNTTSFQNGIYLIQLKTNSDILYTKMILIIH
jgi:hypothetical protein